MKICETPVESRLFFGGKFTVFDFDGPANQFLSFCERQLWDFGENFSQAHRELISCGRRSFGVVPNPRHYLSFPWNFQSTFSPASSWWVYHFDRTPQTLQEMATEPTCMPPVRR